MINKYYTILAKHFAGETSDKEEAKIRKLRDANSISTEEYQHLKKNWEILNQANISFDLKHGLELLNNKIKSGISKKETKIIHIKWVKYAAILIGFTVLIAAAIFDLSNTRTLVCKSENFKSFKLPDGSSVILKKDAELLYRNSHILGFNRNVELNGEAYFQIKKAPSKKFNVKTHNFVITVHGTCFNVKSHPENTYVVLNEGKIEISDFKENNQQESVFLVPGDYANYNYLSGKLILEKVNPLIYNSWINNRIQFDAFSMIELKKLIEVQYDVKVIIKNKSILNKEIYGSSPSDNLNLLIKGLSGVIDCDIEYSNDTIIIK